MRTAPALLVLTLAASTASVAAPVVEFPGGPSAHAVEPRIVEVALSAADLVPAVPTGAETEAETGGPGLTARLLGPADVTPAFSLIGLTWDRPAGATAEPEFDLSVRTRAGGTWTGWTGLEPDGDGPDRDADGPAATRAGTAPVWVGASDGFQVRLDLRRGAIPAGLRALLVEPGRSAADADVGSVPRVASSAHATIAWPTVYRRKDWGADEKLRRSSPRYTGAIQAAFVHHTAGTNEYAPADVPKILRGVYAYHVKGRGWSDIGYNFLVDRFGRTWEGRAGGIDRAVLGAHTGGFNSDSFGVSVMGDYTKAAPSAETLAAVARIIAWKFALTGDGPSLDPLSIVELVSAGGGTSRYRSGTAVDFARISGHTDAGRTECPGEHLYEQLPTIRTLVRQILAEESPYGPAQPALPADGTGTDATENDNDTETELETETEPGSAADSGAGVPDEGGDQVSPS